MQLFGWLYRSLLPLPPFHGKWTIQILHSIALVVDYTGLNIREPADLYLLVTLQVATRVVQSKKLSIGINRESAETLFMECDGTILDDNQRTQKVQLQMSLWHDVLPGFNSYFQGQIRITLDDEIVEKESIGPQCNRPPLPHRAVVVNACETLRFSFCLIHY
ncbi:hypothetical protein WUBG_07348 [Wuchereria bancrofti]|uniref:Uncharacterized protein n=1 Tax=Wuchereria bancrofti TaxID=6293 RepID=J9EHU9_WUCBA|nr:hypothetical protein WUBG_07348 [Wuchereria bancrofti]VDM09131.1 unnamed protein product [Wuchereria bancrofti]